MVEDNDWRKHRPAQPNSVSVDLFIRVVPHSAYAVWIQKDSISCDAVPSCIFLFASLLFANEMRLQMTALCSIIMD